MKKIKAIDLSSEEIDYIKNIAKKTYNSEIYDLYFANKNSGFDFIKSFKIGFDADDTFAILGDTWFLIYRSNETKVSIVDWVATEEGASLSRTIEMIRAFKELFLESKDKDIFAGLRHNTSYWLFREACDRGFCDLCEDEDWFFDKAMPRCLYTPKIKDSFSFGFEEKLEYEELKGTEEEMKYVVHDAHFRMSDKFYKVYQKKDDKR